MRRLDGVGCEWDADGKGRLVRFYWGGRRDRAPWIVLSSLGLPYMAAFDFRPSLASVGRHRLASFALLPAPLSQLLVEMQRKLRNYPRHRPIACRSRYLQDCWQLVALARSQRGWRTSSPCVPANSPPSPLSFLNHRLHRLHRLHRHHHRLHLIADFPLHSFSTLRKPRLRLPSLTDVRTFPLTLSLSLSPSSSFLSLSSLLVFPILFSPFRFSFPSLLFLVFTPVPSSHFPAGPFFLFSPFSRTPPRSTIHDPMTCVCA